MLKRNFSKIFICTLTVLSAVIFYSGQADAGFLKYESVQEKVKDAEARDYRSYKRYPDEVAHNVKAVQDPDRINSIIITWDVNPESEHGFIVARSGTRIDTPEKLKTAAIADSIPAGGTTRIVDLNLKPGLYYYAVVSNEAVKEDLVDLYPGVNYTEYPVSLKFDFSHPDEDVIEEPFRKRKTEKNDDPEKTEKTDKIPRPEADEEPDYIKKPGMQITEPGIHDSKPSPNVDQIIRDTFFKRKYIKAIEKLVQALPDLIEPEDRAKAVLFIGRSHVELGNYNIAVEYFVRDDVQQYYSKEAAFWRDFALNRLE